MNILKDFDTAIAKTENIPSGFVTEKGCYSSYVSNAAWQDHLSSMSPQHRCEYGDGSGGELEEKNGRPPKMASFASSSRMTYLLSREIPGFSFEKKLTTVIGGLANLDGYCETEDSYVFVEAKCREPYSHKSPQLINQTYKDLYAYLQSKLPAVFSFETESVPGTRNMSVKFFCKGHEVVYFDIKQMLCHLLGVANFMLLGKDCSKPIQFLYLLYNPTKLSLPQDSGAQIAHIYGETCTAANNYAFKDIFGVIVDYLIEQREYPRSGFEISTMKNKFKFALCDQESYESYFRSGSENIPL